MSHDKRQGEIEYWWSGHGGMLFTCMDPLEARLKRAFRKVLLAIPGKDYEAFMDVSPTVFCNPGVDATMGEYSVPAMPGEHHGKLRWIYFSASLGQRSDCYIRSSGAHETAHIVLRHYEQCRGLHGEMDADALVVPWGFQASVHGSALKKAVLQRRTQ